MKCPSSEEIVTPPQLTVSSGMVQLAIARTSLTLAHPESLESWLRCTWPSLRLQDPTRSPDLFVFYCSVFKEYIQAIVLSISVRSSQIMETI